MQSLIDENLSEIIRDYKLKTYYEGNLTVHLHNDPDTPPSAPQRRERWKKIRTIGQGGQSEVVLETCVDGGRRFTERAVKKIRLQGGDPKRRYESELGAIVKFSHDRYSKYFVKLLGWFASSTKLYMAMEYFPAGDLYSYVRKHQGLPEEDCRQITCQLLSAIAAMHTEGFAHRDIKPQNILIYSHPHPDTQGSWWVKLGDFGISKRIGVDPNITTSSVGTMLYMAPELFHVNSSEILTSDYREADLWSLGITIFFILTNAVPFQTPASTIKFAQNSGEPFPRAFLEHYGVTEEGQAFIRETLRPEPGTRSNFAMAMDHAWIQALFPSAPESGTQSRRSSMDDDGVTQGATTEISTLSSQPVSQGQYDERHCASNPPRQQAPSQGSFETATVNEATADVYTGTRNRPFAENKSETLLNIKRLHDAARRGRVNDVKMLLDQGVSPAAFYNESTRLLLEKGADIEAKDRIGSTALLIAVIFSKHKILNLLLEKGADIEAKDKNGWTALLIAARYSKHEILELLLEKGADIEAKSKAGWTALLIAATFSKHKILNLLLEKGADIEAKDKNGWTALLIAATFSKHKILNLLLEKGADIEAKDKNGWTALLIAVISSEHEILELLLEKGANVNARDESGRTSLTLAQIYNEKPVSEFHS
ncbi:hypothetical protein FGSG_07816 [Fusarium graminearum PH-1]|uniref:hypothetical protein n=1 Tax=Gibberella zeae (strain ATCC MYA-4620 / CBS 123657 / FGSC 9075 / NRRL 31084 / PH-1) TaxID=229533 RepID=UPI000023D91E|nr:hypothetical protein FGSG_07816 [Fusarium graminearum PH-1]ESU14134.1 hypothetical protein FGSG_07816 [Fusarium graminearum PH-1]|eukprot:XP_011327641.1 hypothetical protein FGSG_07816 [Fusarium graminearum PH-1]